MSEHDYAISRPFTQSILRKLLAPGRRVIIVGASLTDPPLVDALALTKSANALNHRREAPEDGRLAERFVLMPRSSIGYQDQPATLNARIVRHYARRCELVGVRLIVPDFRFQTAQFFEELQSALTHPTGVASYFAAESGARYGLRLTAWWRWWRETEYAGNANLLNEGLTEALHDVIVPLLDRSTARVPGDVGLLERLRLELWVREAPGE